MAVTDKKGKDDETANMTKRAKITKRANMTIPTKHFSSFLMCKKTFSPKGFLTTPTAPDGQRGALAMLGTFTASH